MGVGGGGGAESISVYMSSIYIYVCIYVPYVYYVYVCMICTVSAKKRTVKKNRSFFQIMQCRRFSTKTVETLNNASITTIFMINLKPASVLIVWSVSWKIDSGMAFGKVSTISKCFHRSSLKGLSGEMQGGSKMGPNDTY